MHAKMIDRPLFAYINWAAYDLLSDNKPITETLALRELDEVIRLKESGVRIDYYVMDAFWYDPEGGYRQWHRDHWPEGPGRWLKGCLENDIKPGIWLATNNLMVPGFQHLHPIPEWEGSLSDDETTACMYEGPFLEHFIQTMDLLYDEGIRLFKFDFANLKAVPKGNKETPIQTAISKNSKALREALVEFKHTHPETVLIAYNGFGFDHLITDTWQERRYMSDLQWLDCFDCLYAGDPRPSDVPCRNFWRSKDIYSDHMVFQFQENAVPLHRIDNSAFMIGLTGTCYFRGKEAWKGMFILSLARSGFVNTYYGNLELLNDDDVHFMKCAQELFLPCLEGKATRLTGGPPGKALPYGYIAEHPQGTIFTLINPSKRHASIILSNTGSPLRCIFHDTGFLPEMKDGEVFLGPEQMAVMVDGNLKLSAPDLGEERDVVIPTLAEDIPVKTTGPMSATFHPEKPGTYRVYACIFDDTGKPRRSTGGSPPKGIPMDMVTRIELMQEGNQLQTALNYGKQIWSGLSWAVVVTDIRSLANPVEMELKSSDPEVTRAEFHALYVEA